MIREFTEKLKRTPIFAWVLICAMITTVLSFFIQSALPPEASSAESDAVSDAIEPIIPSDTEIGEVVHSNIRKIGHFVEFGLLGIETALFFFFYTKKRTKELLCCLFSALFIALIDETVQIFSGRGPEISDVWLDFSGFSVLFFVSLGLIFAIYKVYKKTIRKAE